MKWTNLLIIYLIININYFSHSLLNGSKRKKFRCEAKVICDVRDSKKQIEGLWKLLWLIEFSIHWRLARIFGRFAIHILNNETFLICAK